MRFLISKHRAVHFRVAMAAFLALLAATGMEVRAQELDRPIGITAEGQFVRPMPDLSHRFGPLFTGSIGIGRWSDANTFWEGRLQRIGFRKGDRVILVADTTRPDVATDSLGLSLDIVGAGLFVHRTVAGFGPVRPFVSAGAGLYYWKNVRGAYTDAANDLPEEAWSQWSAGFHAGLGTEVRLAPRFALNLGLDYSIIMGELWPTLRLGLENVSTFQFATARMGVRFYW